MDVQKQQNQARMYIKGKC